MRARPAVVRPAARRSRLRTVLVRRTITMSARRNSRACSGSIGPRDAGGGRGGHPALQPPVTGPRAAGDAGVAPATRTPGKGSGSGLRHQSAASPHDVRPPSTMLNVHRRHIRRWRPEFNGNRCCPIAPATVSLQRLYGGLFTSPGNTLPQFRDRGLLPVRHGGGSVRPSGEVRSFPVGQLGIPLLAGCLVAPDPDVDAARARVDRRRPDAETRAGDVVSALHRLARIQ
jgi:hypothetical protein